MLRWLIRNQTLVYALEKRLHFRGQIDLNITATNVGVIALFHL